MKKLLNLTGIGLALITVIGFSSCQKDDTPPTPRQQQYTISPYDQSNISGKVTFKEIIGVDSVQLTIELQGVSQDGSYPVYVRTGTSIENGPVAFKLGFVDGGTPAMTAKIPLSYAGLLKYDGCVNIYRNPNDTVTIVAQSEIGINKDFKSYDMVSPLDSKTVNGQFRVYKRETGSFLVIRLYLGWVDTLSTSHPARVYNSTGQRDFELTDVSASTSVSATDLTDHPYDQLIKYNGMVKVLLSGDAQDVTISQGQFK